MSNIISAQINTLANNLNMQGVDEQHLKHTLTQTVFKNATDEQLVALMIVANQYKLNPFTKEIYAFSTKGNGITPIVSVDGWSKIINDNPLTDGIEFIQDDHSCTCKIYRKDRTHPTTVTEWLDECKGTSEPWRKYPKRMLRHKALIQCARIAFGFSGIYDEDEAHRINGDFVQAKIQNAHANANANANNVIDAQVVDDGYLDYQNEWLPIMEQAANRGMTALQESYQHLPKEHKRQFWEQHANHLKQTAQQTDIHTEQEVNYQEVNYEHVSA